MIPTNLFNQPIAGEATARTGRLAFRRCCGGVKQTQAQGKTPFLRMVIRRKMAFSQA